MIGERSMELWMYGLGKDTDQNARRLKELGFTTIAGSASCAESAAANGMDAYLFSGTYRGPEFKGEEWLSRDVQDVPREWFSSTCPSREEVREYNLQSVKELAKTPHIQGVIIDGCRFASPSSGKVTDAFYTCFCDSCMKKARRMGFDAEYIKRSVSALYDFMHGERVDLLPFAQGIEDWMEFRERVTTEHLIHFTETVHGVNEKLKAGIFIFAPSLSKLVGQSYRALQGKMDLYSPMLYRIYNDPNGPACLNVEIADLLRMINGASFLSKERRIDLLKALTGLDESLLVERPEKPSMVTPEMIFRGFTTEVLKVETARSKVMAPEGKMIPIIQLDDPDIEEATLSTLKGGADAVSYFLFREEWMDERETAFRRLMKETVST